MGFQMSYSFNVRAKTRADVTDAIKSKLDEVVALQSIHDADRALAEKTANDALDLIADPSDDMEFSVSMNGSCWSHDGILQSVSLGVNVGVARPFASTADA